MSRIAPLTALLLLVLPGCVGNFDERLYMTDAGPGTPTFADFCTALPATSLPPGVTNYPIDTTTMRDDLRNVSCLDVATPGNDAYLAIDAAPSERWHFHVRNPPGTDVALYLLGDCDERNCADDRTADACGDGANEHLSVVAPASGGRLILGVDSISAGGFAGSVEIYRPVCGNGMPEHSENCDDGDLDSGDGCDSACRIEVDLASGAPTEAGVNDDYFAANHLLNVAGGRLLGDIAQSCDSDAYAVELAAGTTLRTYVTGRAVATCPDLPFEPPSAGRIALAILAPSGSTTLVSAENGCPMVELPITTSGTYFVRVAGRGFLRPYNYDLHFEVR